MANTHNGTWSVMVHTHPGAPGGKCIGSVTENSEDNARCAALSKYGEQGERYSRVNPGRQQQDAIFEDDEFDVRPA